MAEQFNATPEGQTKEIPNDWFVGIAKLDGKLLAVTTSQSFKNLFGADVENHLRSWIAYFSRSKSKNRNKEEKEEARKRAQESAKIITENTCFTPDQIWKRAFDLREEFKGMVQAPFPIEKSFPTSLPESRPVHKERPGSSPR